MIPLFLITAHFVADFTMQSSEMAQKKRGNYKYLLLHGWIYGCVVGAAAFLAVRPARAAAAAGVMGVSHLVIDWLRIRLCKAFPCQEMGFWSFFADQVLHIAVILGICALWDGGAVTPLWRWLCDLRGFRELVVYGAAFAALWDPACVFVKMLFYYYDDAEQEEPELPPSNPNAGVLIGKLERVIIVVLVLTGQIGSIAFVLTAKSLARHKQLEDIQFAEKYLVGTLASTAIAILTGMLLKVLFM